MRNVSRLQELRKGFLTLLLELKKAITTHRATVQAGVGSKLRTLLERLNGGREEEIKISLGFSGGLFLAALIGAIWLESKLGIGVFSPAFEATEGLVLVQVLVTIVIVSPPFIWLFWKWYSSIRARIHEAQRKISSFEKAQVQPLTELLNRVDSLISQLQAKPKT